MTNHERSAVPHPRERTLVSTMVEIGPRSRMKKELNNRIDHVINCDLLILFLFKIMDIRLQVKTIHGDTRVIFSNATHVSIVLQWLQGNPHLH